MEKEPKPTFGVGDFYEFMDNNVPYAECVKGRIRKTEWLSERGLVSAYMGGGECIITVIDSSDVFDMRWNTQFDGIAVIYERDPHGTLVQREAEEADWQNLRDILSSHPNQGV